jgi:hypothetical protein
MPRSQVHLLPREYKAASRSRTVEDRNRSLISELGYLRGELRRLRGVIAFKDQTLLSTARFFEDILRENKPQSIEGLKRWVSRLKGAVDREQGGLGDDG